MSANRPKPLAVIEGVVAVVLVAVAYLLLKRFGMLPRDGQALFALGFLVVAGAAAGSLSALLRMPRIIGALVAGVVAGPQVLGIVRTADLEDIALANVLALALIALQAGAEITLPSLVRIYKSVLWSAWVQTFLVVLAMGAAFMVAVPIVPFMASVDKGAVIALALLWGVFMLPRSPSVTMAVVSEAHAKGPLSEHALGVVVLLDVLALPLFAAALALARGAVLGEPFELRAFQELGQELLTSALAGITVGLVLALALRITKERILAVVVFGYAMTALCTYLRYDTLLVFVVAGFVVTNLTRLGPTLVHTSEKTASGVMTVFFATAGARIDLQSLVHLWPLALAFCAVRLVVIIASTQVAHRLAKDPPAVRKSAWMTLIAQAGVTIGLATIVADTLPSIGRPFASLVIAIVSVNTFVGAILAKLGLDRAGETGKADAPAPAAAHP